MIDVCAMNLTESVSISRLSVLLVIFQGDILFLSKYKYEYTNIQITNTLLAFFLIRLISYL